MYISGKIRIVIVERKIDDRSPADIEKDFAPPWKVLIYDARDKSDVPYPVGPVQATPWLAMLYGPPFISLPSGWEYSVAQPKMSSTVRDAILSV